MTRVLFKLLFLLLLVCTVRLQGQISANALKSAYLVKIADNFTWEISQEPIQIGILSNSQDFYTTLQKYAQRKNIGGRNINITLLQSPKAMGKYDVLYIGEERNKNLSDFKKELEGTRTLLFTNLAPQIEFSMINFYLSHDQKIKFKINTKFLKKHQFEPSNLMLVLGGSENDILSLFEKKDSSIVFERNSALILKAENSEKEKSSS